MVWAVQGSVRVGSRSTPCNNKQQRTTNNGLYGAVRPQPNITTTHAAGSISSPSVLLSPLFSMWGGTG